MNLDDLRPTVFISVRNDMAIAQEEIFGPVLSVIAYDSEEERSRSPTTPNMASTPPSSGPTSSARGAWRHNYARDASSSTA
jgi:hypothetical protein